MTDPLVSQLVAIRRYVGMTQEDLAERVKVTRARWCETENGHWMPRFIMLRRAVEVLKAHIWVIHPATVDTLPLRDLPDALLHDLLQELSAEAMYRQNGGARGGSGKPGLAVVPGAGGVHRSQGNGRA